MRRTDQEQAREASGGALQRVAQIGGFEREQLLGGAAAQIRAARSSVRAAVPAAAPTDKTMTCSAPAMRHFFEDAIERAGTIAHAVGLAAPRPFGRKPEEVRIGGDRHAQVRGERVHHVLAADAGEIEGFGRAAAVGRPRAPG